MVVTEIFKSIEGEGKRTGKICTFIRLFGCNLLCSYCDSLYSVTKEQCVQSVNMSISEIVDKCKEFKTPYVTVTGGEPLIHKDIENLVLELVNNDFEVNIETNGSVDISKVRNYVHSNTLVDKWNHLFFTVDYKSISSNCSSQMLDINFTKNLWARDVVKFVVGTDEDLDDMKKVVSTIRNHCDCQIFVSPIFGMIEPKYIVEYIKNNDMFDVRMQLQIHKFIWPSDMKGV